MSETFWNGYQMKRLSDERLNDLAVLYRAVYGRALPEKYFQRKYDTAFTGITYTGYIAYDPQNQPAAFYGVIPCFMQYGAGKILAAQSADTMTHPAHRNKGLFVALANLTVELCRNEDIRILFGFPNQHSLPGLAGKLRWQLAGYMMRFNLPVRTLPLEQFISKFPMWRGIYNLYTDHQLKKYKLPQKGLTNTFSTRGFAGVYRDDAYLQYKTYNQTVLVKIHGANVWLKVKNGLVIGDMTMPEDFEKTIHTLKKMARKLGVKQVMFQVSEGTPLCARLQNYAEGAPGFPVMVKDLGSGIPTDQLKFTFADIDIF